MLYVAIDQHLNQLTVNVRNESGDVVLRQQVSTHKERVRKFFDRVAKDAKGGGFWVIVEVCGFNDWLLQLLADNPNCRELVLVQPSKREKQKTDRRDANKLGEVLWVNRHRIRDGKPIQDVRQVHPPSVSDAANRQLTNIRQHLADNRTKVINRVHHILNKHNLKHDCPAKGIQTIKARNWLATVELPDNDRFELNLLIQSWGLFDTQLGEVNLKIGDEYAQNPTAILIESICGISAYGALTIACRLSDGIHRFATPKSLANFWGLAPGCGNSGESTQRIGSITKVGSSIVRRILGNAVYHLLRKDKRMRDWYRRVKARRGSKIAMVAVMRKVATIIWHMVTRNERYRPADTDGDDFIKGLEEMSPFTHDKNTTALA